MDVPTSEIKHPDRVFLVGCPRSGTTLLQSMLAGHSLIASFPETHFFDRGFGKKYRWAKRYVLRGFFFEYLLWQWLRKLPIDMREAIRPGFPRYRPSRAIHKMIRILDAVALRDQRRIWVEKTPGHILHVDTISSLVDGSTFLHLIRDGRAVVASLYDLARTTSPNLWRGFDDLDYCIGWWNHCIDVSARFVGAPRHLVCSYEHLVDDPPEELRRIVRFLGIGYEEEMVDSYADAARSVTTDKESWKRKNLNSKIESVGLEKFNQVFSDTEKNYIQERLNLSTYDDLTQRTSTSFS